MVESPFIWIDYLGVIQARIMGVLIIRLVYVVLIKKNRGLIRLFPLY
jgi:hypothetical protein